MYLLELAGEADRLARAEAAVAVDGLDPVSSGLALGRTVDHDRASSLAMTRRITSLVACVEGDQSDAVAAITSRAWPRSGSVAVRARDVRGRTGIDTMAVQRAVGDVLVDAGFSVDLETPEHEFRVVAAAIDGAITWFLGWLEVEPVRGFGARQPPDRPFNQPGTMAPQLARTLVNLSGVAPGERFLDPMCGPGAMLIEAGLIGAHPVGIDFQSRMVRGARENYETFGTSARPVAIVRGSAHALPIARIDAAAFDAPYGRQSPIGHSSARELVEATLIELNPIVSRVVVVFDRPIPETAAAAGWDVTDHFERPVHRSLTRHVSVLTDFSR